MTTITGVLAHNLWTGQSISPEATARNAFFLLGKVYRLDQPCRHTGTSARMAAMARQGQLGVGVDFIHESFIWIFNFIGQVEEETRGCPAAMGHNPSITRVGPRSTGTTISL